MKNRTRIIAAVAVITILLTTVTAMALNVGSYINPLTKNKYGFIFNGQHSNYNVAGGSYGNPIGYVPPSAPPTPIPTPTPEITAPAVTANPTASAFESFTGKITEITPFYENEKAVEGKFFVLVEDATGGIMNFIVDSSTINVTRNTLKVGAVFTGFYEANRPMLMIYPPQVYADVAVIDLAAEYTVKVDLFDNDLVSKDGTLKLTPNSDTVIVLEDGAAISQSDLGNRRMVVIYSVSTRSIPAQTTPDTIIVLYEKIMPAN